MKNKLRSKEANIRIRLRIQNIRSILERVENRSVICRKLSIGKEHWKRAGE